MLRPGLRFALATAGFVALAVPAGTNGATFAAGPYLPVDGPDLAGNRVVWADSVRELTRVRVSSPTSASGSVIASFPSPPTSPVAVETAASETVLAVLVTRYTDAGPLEGLRAVNDDLLTARWPGPLVSRGTCPSPSAAPLGALDVFSAIVAAPGRDCAHDIAAYDHSGEDPISSMLAPAGAVAPRIAGRYAAWIEPGPADAGTGGLGGTIKVLDRQTGATAYELSQAAVGAAITSLDINDEGSVVYGWRRATPSGRVPRTGGLAWASISDPHPHRLALPAADTYLGRVAGEKIAFVRGEQANQFLRDADLGLTDFDGGATVVGKVIARINPETFDFDGTNLTWLSLGCSGATISVVTAAQPVATTTRRACPLRFSSRPRASRRAIRLGISCAGMAGPNCDSTVKAIVRYRGQPVRIGTGSGRGEGPISLKLTHLGRTLLARRRAVRVQLRARLEDFAFRSVVRSAIRPL